MGWAPTVIRCVVGAALVAALSCSTKNALAPADAGDGGGEEASVADGDSTSPACAAAGGQCIAATGDCLASVFDEGCGSGMLCCVLGPNGHCQPDAAPWLIQASSYNTSCSVDSDCVQVGGFGDACLQCFNCGLAAVNRSSQAQYEADVGKSPAAGVLCNCPPFPNGPCCVDGVCQVSDKLCPARPVISPVDAGADVADAAGAADAVDGESRINDY